MKLAIVGSRTFDDYDLLSKYVSILTEKLPRPHIVIISGGAKGADSLAEQFAREHRYDSQIYPAAWNKYGKSAGFIRNQQIIDNCDFLLAFWDGCSRGTQDSIEKAKKAKIPTCIVYF